MLLALIQFYGGFSMGLKISSGEIRKMILSKLSHNFGLSPAEATNEHFYKALVLVVNDIMNQRRSQVSKNAIYVWNF